VKTHPAVMLGIWVIIGILMVAMLAASEHEDLYIAHVGHHTCIVDHTAFSQSISCDWSKK